jgi:hypothetical protein
VPFAYAGGHPLRHGLQVGDSAVLVAVAAALVGAAALAFARGDMNV